MMRGLGLGLGLKQPNAHYYYYYYSLWGMSTTFMIYTNIQSTEPTGPTPTTFQKRQVNKN